MGSATESAPAGAERPRYKLPRSARLLTQREFRRVYSRGRRAHGRSLTVVGYRTETPGFRLGLAVSKAHGPAVRRNKIKRLLREAFRLERPTLRGRFDMVLIPREQPRYRLDELRVELRRLVDKLEREKNEPAQPHRRRKPRGDRQRTDQPRGRK